MPGRKIPLATNEIYHVFNRGVASQPIFFTKRDYEKIWKIIFYYQAQKPPVSFSHFLRLSGHIKNQILTTWESQKKFLVEIISLSLLPNHFHFLLKQLVDGGISIFMSNLANSYTRHLNTKNQRPGHLFQGKFKAVWIETDEQLLHINRYIHLNPYSSFVIKNLKDLETYPYSSLPEYLGLTKTNFFQKEIILNKFKNLASYKKFVFDQADYQRKLNQIKHLLIE